LTDHAECEEVILHTWCGQLLHIQRGGSLWRSVTIRKNQRLRYVVHGRGCNPHRSLWRHW